MKVFAKFDEIPSMTLQDIKKTKRYGHTAFTAQLICVFVFAYTEIRFSHDAAHLVINLHDRSFRQWFCIFPYYDEITSEPGQL